MYTIKTPVLHMTLVKGQEDLFKKQAFFAFVH